MLRFRRNRELLEQAQSENERLLQELEYCKDDFVKLDRRYHELKSAYKRQQALANEYKAKCSDLHRKLANEVRSNKERVRGGRPSIKSDVVNQIRALHAEGRSCREIAQKLNISKSTVANYIQTFGADNTPMSGQIELNI